MISQMLELLKTRGDFFSTLLYQHAVLSYSVVFIASIIGLLLGIFIERYRKMAKIITSSVNFLYTIPSIAMFGFLIPFFGIGTKTAVISLVIYALLPIVLNTYTGISNVPKEVIDAARAMGATQMQVLCKIKLPLALPAIYAAIRNALIMTIAVAGVAAFIGAGGLGVAIFRGITTNNIALMVLSSLMIALFAIVSDLTLEYYGKFFIFSRKKVNKLVYIIPVAIILSVFIVYMYNDAKPEDEDVVHIATKPMTEQLILGEITRQMIVNNSDLKVKMTNGVGGGTSNIHVGMVNRKFDLYPEYTGTSWNQVLGEKSTYKENMFNHLQNDYTQKFGLKYENLYGFNNTFGIAMKKDVANKYNIRNYSDLARESEKLVLGAEYDYFERKDGYQAFKDTYNTNFKKTFDIDVALKYKALDEDKIDAIVIFTTDAKLADDSLIILEDNKNFYPSYKAGNVVRTDVIKKHPELVNILAKLNNVLTDKEMAQLNYKVEVENKEAKDVARDFLLKKKLIK